MAKVFLFNAHAVLTFAHRGNAAASEIALPGKVTSLDHNPGEVLPCFVT